MKKDEFFMSLALEQAKIGKEKGEIPVGAVIIKNEKIIARAYNNKENLILPTKHAEIVAIENACKVLNNWRLNDCTIYTTFEPCLMCVGAIINARLKRLVFGASDKRFGCVNSIFKVENFKTNYNFEYSFGILEEDCSEIITDFFKKLRNCRGK